MSAYYNEHDAFAAQWLRNLIAAGHLIAGDVDERDIQNVQPEDVRGYTRCHFFAGIGGWDLALQLSGWGDRSVWTGSCPCQPFSSASNARHLRRKDDRHLWPIWARLIAECRPRAVFGEQVAAAGDWFDGVCDDLEDMGYAVGAAVLPATALGADHARARIYFVGHANRDGQSEQSGNGSQMDRLSRSGSFGAHVALEDGISRRVDVLRAYGNAIVPHVAAEFISAYLACRP